MLNHLLTWFDKCQFGFVYKKQSHVILQRSSMGSQPDLVNRQSWLPSLLSHHSFSLHSGGVSNTQFTGSTLSMDLHMSEQKHSMDFVKHQPACWNTFPCYFIHGSLCHHHDRWKKVFFLHAFYIKLFMI